MDFLYAAVCIFAMIYLALYLKSKYSYLKEREENTMPTAPYDLGMVFKTWVILIILLGFTIYFLFR